MVPARRRGWRAGLLLALGPYLVLVATNPFLHHDLACHFKSPTHCTACTSSPSASKIERGIRLDPLLLSYSGEVDISTPKVPDLVVSVRSSGRSPPA